MTELEIFMLVFIGQIVALSAYFPTRVFNRAKKLFTNYPPNEYPKLYPKGGDFYTRSLKIYQLINGFNFVLGWIILWFIYSGDLLKGGRVHPLLPWGYFMLQMLPSQLMEYYGFKLAKLMKKQDQRTTRSAVLTPRNWRDYISPVMLTLLVFSFLAFVGFSFGLEADKPLLESNGFLMSIILFLGYCFFFMLSTWLIYGKKADPYQSQQDRFNMVKLTIHTFCFTLLACTVFMALTLGFATTGLKSIIPILMSVFLQFLVFISMGYMLNNVSLEDIDFDVYRAQANHK